MTYTFTKRRHRLVRRARLRLRVRHLAPLALAAHKLVRDGACRSRHHRVVLVLRLQLLVLLAALLARHLLARHGADALGINLARDDAAPQLGVLLVLEVEVQRADLGLVRGVGLFGDVEDGELDVARDAEDLA